MYAVGLTEKGSPGLGLTSESRLVRVRALGEKGRGERFSKFINT